MVFVSLPVVNLCLLGDGITDADINVCMQPFQSCPDLVSSFSDVCVDSSDGEVQVESHVCENFREADE